jgi:A/G-specific adenine glycosylase
VLARRYGIEGEKSQQALAAKLVPARNVEAYTQGLMDLGATVCTRTDPACGRCPVARDCVARREDRIAELPVPRKRKPLPERRANWLVLLHRGTVLLERRPSSGLWGGLWTFPEGPGKDVRGYCARTFYCEVAKPQPLDEVQHGFTHFRLVAQPLRCEVRRLARGAQAPGTMWLDLADAAQAAVPAPVRVLLKSL